MKLSSVAQGSAFLQDESAAPSVGAAVSSGLGLPAFCRLHAPLLKTTLFPCQKTQPTALQMSGTSGTRSNGYR